MLLLHHMTSELIERLQFLADKYEISSFCDEDPSQFLRWYKLPENCVKGDRPLTQENVENGDRPLSHEISVNGDKPLTHESSVNGDRPLSHESSVNGDRPAYNRRTVKNKAQGGLFRFIERTAQTEIHRGRESENGDRPLPHEISVNGDRPLPQIANIECASFIAAMLAFGNRKQFIPKIKEILTLADKSGGISLWLKNGAKDFPTGVKKFYRFYSYDDMHILFDELSLIISKYGSLGEYFKQKWNSAGRCGQSGKSSCPLDGVAEDCNAGCSQGQAPLLDNLIAEAFPKAAIVPKGKNSANKRVHMFLRWMCRQNSPVDLGIWTWYSPADLLIPLDVHVMQEATKLGLLPEKCSASRKTAVSLTAQLAQAFPGDPSRGDFALFGLGVDLDQNN